MRIELGCFVLLILLVNACAGTENCGNAAYVFEEATRLCVCAPNAVDIGDGVCELVDGATPDGSGGGPCDEEGATRPCAGDDTGACQPGEQTCRSRVWSDCEGAVRPTPEVCNGIDDDCDGTPDGAAADEMCASTPGVTEATCTAGACVPTECAAGLGDCDGEFENGCEAELAEDNANCGMCGRACGESATCVEGECADLPLAEWIATYGDPDIADPGAFLDVDDSGRAIVSGSIVGTTRFGADELVTNGDGDFFVGRLSPSGDFLSSRTARVPGSEVFIARAGEEGRINGAGFYSDPWMLGVINLPHAGGPTDFFVAELSSTLVPAQGQGFGSDGLDSVADVVTSGGVTFVIGTFQSELTLGTSRLVTADLDSFAAAFDRSGAALWARSFDATLRSLVVFGDSVYVTGSFAGTVDFGGGPLTAAARGDVVLLELDKDTGGHRQSHRYGGDGNDIGFDLVATRSGVAVLGEYTTDVSLGGEILPARDSSSTPDVFLLFVDATGAHVWSRSLGGGGNDRALQVGVDDADNYYLTARFSEAADGDLLPRSVVAAPPSFVVVSTTADGTPRWAEVITNVQASAMKVRPTGEIWISGAYTGELGWPGESPPPVVQSDNFVLKLVGR